MEDNEFWSKVWKYSITGGCVLASLLFASCQHSKLEVVRMVEAGADPIAARCAIEAEPDRSMCAFVVAEN